MKDPIQKRIELWFRKLLIQSLGRIFRRQSKLLSTMDFNRCKFLFIRQDRIGDVLISTPLFETLKKHYPNAILDVLLSNKNHFVLENHPLIRKRWIYRKQLVNIFSMIRSLRKERYDFAIDLMDNPSATSTILCLLANAKWNVGIEKENSFVYDINVPMLSRRNTHIIDRIAQLLSPFGINPRKEQFTVSYYTSLKSDEFADNFLREKNVLDRPLIGVNISARDEVRFWGIEKFQRLLKYFSEIYPGYKTLLLYQPSDERRANTIAESNPTVLLSPVTSLFDQYAALIKRVSFLITPDTSSVHLASAFKIGVVVLYVQSNKTLRIWEPYETDYEAIVTDVDNLKTISVESVQNAFKKLVERSCQKIG